MIKCRLKGGPLNGHVKQVDAAIVAYGVVYFTVQDAGRISYRVKYANSQTAVLEFAE